MGTRADFYMGRGEQAEWLGSFAWDGYPEGVPDDVLTATTEEGFRAAVDAMLSGRQDATRVADGWPWPWPTSSTTDYAYAFDVGQVFITCFGRGWVTIGQVQVHDAACKLRRAKIDAGEWNEDVPEPPDLFDFDGPKSAVFPNMKDRANVATGPRSGLLVVGVSPTGKVTVE